MTSRLVGTSLGMETTPGDRSTLLMYGVDQNPSPTNPTGPFRVLVGMTYFGYSTENQIPIYVADATANKGFYLDAAGVLSYRNGSATPVGQLTHVLLIPTIGQKKVIEISCGTKNAVTGDWYVTVNGLPAGTISNTAGLRPSGLRCFGGSTTVPCAPMWLHEYETDFFNPTFYTQWDGSGYAAAWDITFATSVGKYGSLGMAGNAGPDGTYPRFTLVDDLPQSGRYCIVADDIMDSFHLNTSLTLSTQYTINWATTSFSFEIEFDNLGELLFLVSTSPITNFVVDYYGKIYYDDFWGNTKFTIHPTGTVPSGGALGNGTVWYFAWNHVTQEVTSLIDGVGSTRVLNTTNFPDWGGGIPTMTGVDPASQNEMGYGLHQCRLYRFKISVDGYADLIVDFTNMRPPPASEIITATQGPYTYYKYFYTCNNGNVLEIFNPQLCLRWVSSENAIDYVGPNTPNDYVTTPTTPGYLPYSKINEWFQINGYDDGQLTHTLLTAASYVKNDVASRYEFTWPGSVTTPKAVKVRAGVVGMPAGTLSDSATFYITYKADDVNFEPTFFDSTAFDTTVTASTFTHYDYFESTAFQWQFFEMTYSEAPQSKLRKLKYYTGSQWTGVPIKMWNGTGWVEVALKVCTATNTFTKISG